MESNLQVIVFVLEHHFVINWCPVHAQTQLLTNALLIVLKIHYFIPWYVESMCAFWLSDCIQFSYYFLRSFRFLTWALVEAERHRDKKLLQRAKQTRKLCFILLYCWMLVSLFAYVWYIFLFHIYFRQFISSVGANHVKKYETFFEICRKIDNRVTTMLVDL